MIRLLWASQLSGIGNAYGYSTQADKMLEALRRRTDVFVIEERGKEYDIAVHIITPDKFQAVDSAHPQLLFTMYEATTLPYGWVKPINEADVLVVPCKQNVELFGNYYKRGKVERCRLGIDPEQYPFYQRKRPDPGEPFRFLWVGAPNPRKGFQLALASWTQWLRTGRMPKDVQLYMKSSGTDEDKTVKFKAAVQMREGDCPDHERAKCPRCQGTKKIKFPVVDFFEEKDCNPEAPDLPGIVFDTRTYTREQMRELYHSAHAFLLPSVGEGWGLTLAEALATGAPSIWTHWSGPVDFADESIGFPITNANGRKDWSMAPLQMIQAEKIENPGSALAASALMMGKDHIRLVKAHDSYGAIAHGDALVRRFEQIYHGYDEALRRGKKASERMHSKYTWADCAEEFVEICKRRLDKEGRR